MDNLIKAFKIFFLIIYYDVHITHTKMWQIVHFIIQKKRDDVFML